MCLCEVRRSSEPENRVGVQAEANYDSIRALAPGFCKFERDMCGIGEVVC